MSQTYLSTYTLGDIMVRFPQDPVSGCVGLEIMPAALARKTVPRRETLRGLPCIDAMPGKDPWPASVVESLVQFKLAEDPYPSAFAQGLTMRNSASVAKFVSVDQQRSDEGGTTSIVTRLTCVDGSLVEHRLSHRSGEQALGVSSSFTNRSSAPVKLEMLGSFSLSGITPFASDDAPERLRVHRVRSGWSAEGRLETRSIEELHLERSWSGAAMFCERFGQLGTLPVRRWFPFIAVEDTEAGVVWGAQLAWSGSWQMEIFRQHDDVCVSGGLADHEFGHWLKTVLPGETLIAPPAVISCVHGGLDELCDRLTAMQGRAVAAQPAVEQELPVIFNEWCTSWGNPSHENLCALADRLRGSGVRYLVMDAGWYKGDAPDWISSHGDWIPNRRLFPQGLEATARAIGERGLIPGIWFEMETVGSQSTAFSLTDHLLKRGGRPLTVRQRRFWDLNDPWSVDYLTKRVIELLARCGFGYLKVDYNETAGIGCDDPDSLGEGLRKQIEGQYRFFDKLRQRLPELVIENCASGGHRLEPAMLARTAMSSFSDAHEIVEIPIIAANLHRLILPQQSQIWAVLRSADSDQRLVYSLAATFLGRMCLSGEITGLSRAQWQRVEEALTLYRAAAPIIKHGLSRRFAGTGASWRRPRGWQAVVRTALDQRRALVVIHTFENAPGRFRVPLPKPGSWKLAGQLGGGVSGSVSLAENSLRLEGWGDFSGQVMLLTQD